MTNSKMSSALNGEKLDELLSAKFPLEQSALDGEAADLQQLFAAMRENSAMTAERMHTAAVRTPRRSPSVLPKHRLAWGLAFAVLAVSVATPLEIHHRKAEAVFAEQREHERLLNEQRTDEALLSNIERDLSSSLPRPLEPLSVKETSASTGATKGNNE